MAFDVQIVIKCLLGAPDAKKAVSNIEAWTHITLRDGGGTQKRWHVSGAHDHRFPGTGPLWLNFKRSPNNSENIILLNKHGHEWAELEKFPQSPTIQSNGFASLGNLNYPACGYTHNHKWLGSWWINQSARQKNLPLFDPNEGWFQQAIDTCSQDTGWRYSTSSGWGATAGAGLGGGIQHPTLVLQRKEPNDARLWDLTISAAGVGLMTPGISAGGSTEDTPSVALSAVRTGPGGKLPFPVADLGGTVLFFDVGAGVGVGKGKVGVGVGGSITTFLFLGGGYMEGMMPALASIKAVLQTASGSGSGGKSGGLLSAGAQGLVYAGRGSVKLRT